MKIGVGITTTSKRMEHEKYWQDIAYNFCDGMKVAFVKDVDGVAKAKNECLRILNDCDHIFLFDDDCFPISRGWQNIFIGAANNSNYKHFNYLVRTQTIRPIECFEGTNIVAYNNTAGCMMYLTKEVVEKVGAFNEKFGKYGFEHAEYSLRVQKAFDLKQPYTCPMNASQFIYSMDLQNTIDFDFMHKPALTSQEMIAALEVAKIQAQKEIEDIFLPL